MFSACSMMNKTDEVK